MKVRYACLSIQQATEFSGKFQNFVRYVTDCRQPGLAEWAVNTDSIAAVERILQENRRLTASVIAAHHGISQGLPVCHESRTGSVDFLSR